MKRKIMPLWFADVIACENVLSKMAENGFHLTDFKPFFGIFSFEEGEKAAERYRICLAGNCGGNPPKGLLSKGWERVCGGRNYYVAKTDDFSAEPPSYKSWKTLNRVVMVISLFIFCWCLGVFVGSGGRFIIDSFTAFEAVHILMFVLSLVIMAAGLKANRKLSKTDINLHLTGVIKTIPEENFIYTKQQEKQMLRSGEMLKKSPLGWFYSPDSAEKMVEEMAKKGWLFYRFNTMGTVFYFVKSQPQKIKFVVDYQNEASSEYFTQCIDDGWKLEFTSAARAMSFVIWSKKYGSDEETPEFYTDGQSVIKRARRTAYTFGISMGAVILAAVFILYAAFTKAGEMGDFVFIVVPMYILVLLEYGVFFYKVVSYYIRMKRKYRGAEKI